MMEMKGIASERSDLFKELKIMIGGVKGLVEKPLTSIEDGISLLSSLRELAYEDINQIQHAAMIISAREYLERTQKHNLSWKWNPRNSGTSLEPDLQGSNIEESVLLVAEITTSSEPVGTIQKRMASTLAKLNNLAGEKFYFVQTDRMVTRANTKINKGNYDIKVIKLPNSQIPG
jgi:hypothetical protein